MALAIGDQVPQFMATDTNGNVFDSTTLGI